MKLHLWRGYHSNELVQKLKHCWDHEELLILVPTQLKDFSFLNLFPEADLQLHGEWSGKPNSPPQAIKAATLDKNVVLGVFTSGTSSGQSRLVLYTKENILASLSSIRELYEGDKIKKIFCYPQPTHTFGLVLGYMQSLVYNAELVFADGAYSKKAHEQWLENVDANTLTLGTPTHFLDLIQYVKTTGAAVKKSYTCIAGGARVTCDLWAQMQSVLGIEKPSVGYGATEAAPGVTHLGPGIAPAEDGDIGYALKNVHVQISDQGLRFTGPNVCYAIFENGELKKSDSILLRDLVVADQTKRFTFIGRTDLIINRGGLKISLEVVEGKLSSHFGCKALAVSLYDERLGEDLGIMLQAETSDGVPEFLLNEFGIKIAAENILLGTIPLNANGKFDRKEATKFVLRKRAWKFPVSVKHMQAFLPHRGPAIWLDSLLHTEANHGVGVVRLKENAHYFNDSKLQESSCIEWAAQTMGYTLALNEVMQVQKVAQATRTFIAEVRNAEFYFDQHKEKLKPGADIETHVRCTHDFGPLRVIEAHSYVNKELLAKINMKVFSA
jgi:predicted hotdog family 3-hydroxylacyl-ACP dehydratase